VRRITSWRAGTVPTVRVTLLLGMGLVVGCWAGEVALDGRPCPCAVGWTCDDGVCVAAQDASVREGGVAVRDGGDRHDDAGAVDGGRSDAGAAQQDAGDRDAGVDDAGRLDVGPRPIDAGTEPCGALFCASHEVPIDDEWDTTIATGGLTRERAPGRMGMALRARAEDSREAAYAALPAVSGRQLWARFEVYVDELDPPIRTRSTAFYLGDMGGESGLFLHVLPTGEGALLTLADETTPFGSAGDEVPLDTWICVEILVEADSDREAVRLYLDGMARGIFTSERGGLSFYRVVGAGAHASTGASVVYVDDVVVAESRVGCD